MSEADNVTPIKRQTRKLAQARIKSKEIVQNSWVAFIPHSDTVEDVTNPEYFQHFAANLRPGDEIKCLWDDMTRYVDLLVISAARLHATVAIITNTDLGSVSKAPADDYADKLYVKYRGRYHQYAVMNDAEVLQHGFDTQDAATLWMRDYRKNILKAG